MARGHQKIQSQQKNAKKMADLKKKDGHDQKAAAQKALQHQCSVCKPCVTMVTCPFNKEHRVPEKSFAKHVDVCNRKSKEGYIFEDKDEAPESSKYFYESSKSVNSVVVDDVVQREILTKLVKSQESACADKTVPRTPDLSTVILTPRERLAVYDYVVDETKDKVERESISIEELANFSLKNDKDEQAKPKSRLALLAEQRDYKRRRQSYRAKNVHITKRSYTEVIREVIENRTGDWKDYIGDRFADERNKSHSKSPDRTGSRSRMKASSSSSRFRSRSPDSSPTSRRHSIRRSFDRRHSRSRSKSSEESSSSSYDARNRGDVSSAKRRKKKHKKEKKKKHKHR